MANFARFRYISKVFKKIIDPSSISLIVLFLSYMIYNCVKKYYTSQLNEDLTKKFFEATKIKIEVRIYDSQKADVISTPTKLYLSTGLMDLNLTDREIISLLIHDVSYHKRYHYGSLTTDIGLTAVLGSVVDSLREHSSIKTNIAVKAFYFALLVIISEGAIDLTQSFISKVKDTQSLNMVKKFGYSKDILSAYKKIIASEKEYKITCGKPCKMFKKIDNLLETNPELKDKLKAILNDKDIQKEMVDSSKNMNTLQHVIDNSINNSLTA